MKRIEFLQTGLLTLIASMFSFSLFSKENIVIKKNPVIEFTPENISEFNVGLYVIEDRADVVKFSGVGVGCVWKLVYQVGYTVNNLQGQKVQVKFPKYGLCNALTDGWTYWVGSKEQLCTYLNDNPHGVKYRILTKEELLYIINHRSNLKQLVRHVKS